MSTLMVSISGIRGIIGGGLEPKVIVKYSSAYADFIGKGKVDEIKALSESLHADIVLFDEELT